MNRRILTSVLLTLGIGNFQTATFPAFLPIFINEHEWEGDYRITNDQISWILSIYSFAQVMISPLIGKLKNTIGTKNTIMLGFFIYFITTQGLAMIANLKDS